MHNWIEVSPVQAHHCCGVEGGRRISEKQVEGVAGSV